MTDIEKFIAWLGQFNLTRKKIESILALTNDYSIENFDKIQGLDKIFKFQDLESMRAKANIIQINQYFKALDEQNIKVVTFKSENYPKKFYGLSDAPAMLFCKGDLSLFDKFAIAIVGTRKPTNYGRIVTDEFARDLALNDAVIVSGLAYGVDSISHRKTLDVGGKTIAVLGGGMNRIYPSEHTSLAQEIAEKGLLISEYAPHISPTRYSFVDRNRIIAALSDGVLITEAGLTSGTKSTKEYALQYGREVFAVPGSIKSESSALPNTLIASLNAKCVLNADDILFAFNRQKKSVASKKVVLNSTEPEEKILNLLKDGEKDINYLQENTNFDIKELNQYLTMLEIRGIIKKLPSNYYAAE